MRQWLTAMLMLALGSGCAAVQSLNLQRSALRSAGDVSVTAVLDQMADDQWEAAHAEITDVVQRLQAFMADGAVAELVHPKLVEAVRGLIPAQYKSLGNTLLASIENTGADVNTTKIGADNVARIDAFLTGAATGLHAYRGTHRPPDAPDPEAGPASTLTTDIDIPAGDMPPDEDMDEDNGSDG